METTLTTGEVRRSIERRLERLQDVEAERDQIRKEIDGLEMFVAVMEDDYGIDLNERDAHPQPYADFDGIEEDDIPITYRVRNAVVKVLSEKRPLHRSKVLEGVEALGVEIVAQDPLASLSAYVSQDDKIMSVPWMRGHWTLTQEPTGKRPLAPASED